jgi:CO/xanthine dehydrogenase FAD-binding subunit
MALIRVADPGCRNDATIGANLSSVKTDIICRVSGINRNLDSVKMSGSRQTLQAEAFDPRKQVISASFAAHVATSPPLKVTLGAR